MSDDVVAIVGTGMVVPGANSPAEFWTLLNTGQELFTSPQPNRWRAASFQSTDSAAEDKSYQLRGGFIVDFTPHEKLAAELTAGDAIDLQGNALWLRHSLYQAFGQVSHGGGRIGYFVGYTPDGSQSLEESMVVGAVRAFLQDGPGSELPDSTRELALKDLDAHYRHCGLPIAGIAPHRAVAASCRGILPEDTVIEIIDTACSSSLYAIDTGARAVLGGELDIAVCGGSYELTPSLAVLFAQLSGLSRSGAVHSLDRDADGTLFADGAALVVLKRLSRAVADGDPVYGTIAGIGLSSDGKGRAIYAPSSEGLIRAAQSALSRSQLTPDDVELIIAHATGTPRGDEAEFLSLRECYGGGSETPVTSNKSIIGHTGWASGAVSVIHALLAMRHGTIPAQYRFSEAPESFRLAGSGLVIPQQSVTWPPHTDGRPRIAAVSSFGFGGTNAHVLLREHISAAPRSSGYARPTSDDLVIVGWASKFPDDHAATFGVHYPLPSLSELTLPRNTVRHLDRTQLMLISCVAQLKPILHGVCDRNPERTGVVIGHSGPTRHSLLAHLRLYLDDIEYALTSTACDEGMKKKLIELLRTQAREAIPRSTQDSEPGKMPNIISARLSNYFDLRGPTITVDDGNRSLITAFQVAARYLRCGDIDLALVGAAYGNSAVEWTSLLDATDDDMGGRSVQEGAVLFAMASRPVAEREGLTIFGALDISEACHAAK